MQAGNRGLGPIGFGFHEMSNSFPRHSDTNHPEMVCPIRIAVNQVEFDNAVFSGYYRQGVIACPGIGWGRKRRTTAGAHAERNQFSVV